MEKPRRNFGSCRFFVRVFAHSLAREWLFPFVAKDFGGGSLLITRYRFQFSFAPFAEQSQRTRIGTKMRTLCSSLALFVVCCYGFEYVHHNTDEALKVLEDIHERCPDVTNIYTVGESVEGRPLAVIEFSSKPASHVLRKY